MFCSLRRTRLDYLFLGISADKNGGLASPDAKLRAARTVILRPGVAEGGKQQADQDQQQGRDGSMLT